MKRLIFIATACLLIALLSAPDWLPMAPGAELYIRDNERALSNSTKKEITVFAAALIEQTDVHIEVISTDYVADAEIKSNERDP